MKRGDDPVMRMQLLVCLALFVATSIVLWIFFGWFVALIPMYIVVLGGLAVATRYAMFFKMPSKRCSACGYDLTMSNSKPCPSCGAKQLS